MSPWVMSMTDQPGVRGVNTAVVTEWLADNVDGVVPPFSFEPIAGGHSNLTYKVTDATEACYVLRRPPLGAVLATAHDMAREHRIIRAVGRTEVPVPAALALCEDVSVNDAPFYVMEYVDGRVLDTASAARELLPRLPERLRLGESVVDALAKLHTVDPDTIGLGDLGRKEAYLDRQLRRWRKQWEKSKTRDLPAMEETYELLMAAKPEQIYTGIVHGDYRLGNMLGRSDGSVAAVLDWELCTLGDPLADVGYLLNSWTDPGEDLVGETSALPTACGGFQSRDELVESYCRSTGREVVSIDYYRSFQSWRLAAIVEGVLSRYLKGVMGDAGADTSAFLAQVDGLAESALQMIRRVA